MAGRGYHHPGMPTFKDSLAAGGRVVPGNERGDPSEVVGYDTSWPGRYEEMRARLAAALGPTARRIHHVGSTAIAGLAAKPIVDVQVSVPDAEYEAAFRGPIEAQGFVLRFVEPGHRYFRPPPGLARLWQVHVCSVGSRWERDHLLFRDYLRAHAGRAADYAALKRRLAEEYRHERIAYTDAKAPFIEETLALAEEWATDVGWQP